MNIFLSVDSNWGTPNGFVDAIVEAQVHHVLFSFEKLTDQDTAPVIAYLQQHQPESTHHEHHQSRQVS